MQPQPLSQRGLTLVESATALAITAVAAALAAPNLQGLMDLRRLDGAASQLAADLQLARSEAVARNQPVRLSWNEDQACYLVHTGAASDCRCDAAGTASCSGTAQALHSVAWSAADRLQLMSNTASILFDPLHGTASPSATWRVVGSDGRAVHQIVNVMGRVRSCSPLAAVPGYRAC